MKKVKLLLTILSIIAVINANAQVPFTPGNVVIYRAGDATNPITTGGNGQDANAYPLYLDEYTPAGVLVQSIAMPTVINGSNKMCTATGNTVSSGGGINGLLSLSADGHYLMVPGYNVPVGTINVVGTSGIDRTIGRVDYNGVINTSTAINFAGTGSIKTAASTNGTDIWFPSTSNIWYTTLGSSTATQIAAPSGGPTFLNISNGQLYTTEGAGARRLSTVGTGTPTTAGQTLTQLPGFPTTSVPDQYIFFDMNPAVSGVDVLYVADHGSVNPGIRKYSLVSGTWTLNGSVGVDADDYMGLTGTVSGGVVTLFATGGTVENSNPDPPTGFLATLTDATGYNVNPNTFTSTPTVLFTAATGTQIRGIALAPQAPPLKVSPKIFLQGAYSSVLGRHKDVTSTWAAVLAANATSQPFNTSAFGNYNGDEVVSSSIFTSTAGTDDIVDWVLVELHDATTPSTIVARKAGFVLENGSVVATDKTSPIAFDKANLANGNYYVVIKHRNHLPIRSASALSLSNTTTSYDFTDAQSKAYQDGAVTTNAAMASNSGVFMMWGGNANSNNTTRFTGLNNDAGQILSALGNNQAAVLNNVYNAADLNLDGTVRYTGLNNDAGVLLGVLGNNQAAIYTQHQ